MGTNSTPRDPYTFETVFSGAGDQLYHQEIPAESAARSALELYPYAIPRFWLRAPAPSAAASPSPVVVVFASLASSPVDDIPAPPASPPRPPPSPPPDQRLPLPDR